MTREGIPFILSLRPEEKFAGPHVRGCFGVVNVPLTKIEPAPDIVNTVSALNEYKPDSIVLTSAVGSELLLRYANVGFIRELRHIFCIGKATARPLRSYNTEVPGGLERNTSGLASLILSRPGGVSKVAVFRSREGNPELIENLRNAGLEVREFIAYTTVELDSVELGRLIRSPDCRGIAITSPMEARLLASYLRNNGLKGLIGERLFFSIGEPTRLELEKLGIKVSAPAGLSDFTNLLDGIEKKYCSDSGEWI